MERCITCSLRMLYEGLRVHSTEIISLIPSVQTVRPHPRRLNYLIQRGYCENTEQRIKDMGKKSFWNKFYDEKKHRKTFDWFFEYRDIRSAIQGIVETLCEQNCRKALKVLDVGCGTSSMALEFANDYRDIANVWCLDFSIVALQELRSQQGEHQWKDRLFSNVDYIAADAMYLPFKDETFDLVLEKGTLDAMLKTQLLLQRAPNLVCEVVRVLSRGGIYCQFSDEDPELRLPILEEARRNLWIHLRREISVSYKNLFPESSINYFMYCISHKNGNKSRN